MAVRFSKKEQAFIDGTLNKHEIAEFLVKNIGNMELNNRLYQALEDYKNQTGVQLNQNQVDNLKLLERWTYQILSANEIRLIAQIIIFAKALQANGIELLTEEKISLLELKQISRFSLLLGKKNQFREGDIENNQAKDLFNPLSAGDKPLLEQLYDKSRNKEFRELYENMVVCEELAADLRKNISIDIYQPGDILIRNEAKSAVIENVAQEGITSLQKQQDTRIIFFDMFDELDKDYPGRMKSTNTPSNAADVSKINVTDILSSDVYRLPEAKLRDQDLMKQIQQEKDPKKLAALLIKNGAVKVQNHVAEEFVRTEDVKKSPSFNNLEDNLANTLEILMKSAKDQDEFVTQAKPRVEAYLAVSGLQAQEKKPDLTQSLGNYSKYPQIANESKAYNQNKQNINNALENLCREHNKTGLKAKIIQFISGTLVSLGLKKSTAEETIHKISGKFTKKLDDTRGKTPTQNKIIGH